MGLSGQHAPRRAAIHTLGCRLNQAESNLIAEQLSAAGYTLVDFDQPAELGVVHTCTVTREADAKSRKLIRQFIRRNPEALTVAIGCYAQLGAEALAQIEGLDLIVGNQNKLRLLDYLPPKKQSPPLIHCEAMGREDFSIPVVGCGAPLRHRANLKIQDGCNFMCSFCIIPFARGRVRSRTMDNLLEEAQSLIARGARELVLTGVNLGTYASEGASILEVVDRLNALPGLARIRISSIEPTTIPEALFAAMADPDHALTPYLHIPLQSGSNRVLKAMGRHYTREAFRAFIEEAADRAPDLGLGTDILVGFPGETEEDFAETADLLEHSPLQYAHIFKYSERPGSAAARRPEKSDPKVAARRSLILHQLSEEKRIAFYTRHLGQRVEVLFEEEIDGRWQGYTGNYVRVAAPAEAPIENRIASVRVDTIEGPLACGSVEGLLP